MPFDSHRLLSLVLAAAFASIGCHQLDFSPRVAEG